MNRNSILLFTGLVLFFSQCKGPKPKPIAKPDISTLITKDTLNWKPLGPFGSPIPMASLNQFSPHGTGRFMCVNVHPDNPKEIIIGHATSGLFKTTDGGITWNQKMNLGFACGVFKIIRFNTNTKHLIACTAMDIGNSRQYGYGLIESFDGGETWIRNSLKFDPEEYQLDQSRDIAICDSKKEKSLVAVTAHKIHLSNDGAITWQMVYESKYNLKHVVVSPHDPQTIIVTGNGILLSTDGGYTFNDISNEVSKAFGLKNGTYNIHNAAFSLKYPGKVYFVSQNQSVHIVEASLPDMSNFQLINSNACQLNLSRLEFRLKFDKSSGTEAMWIGTTRIFKSIDGGHKFSQCGNPAVGTPNHSHDDVNEIFLDDKGKIYLSTDGGVDVTENDGANWKSLTDNSVNLNGSLIFGFDRSKDGTLMAGTQDNGIFIYKNGVWKCSDMYGDGGRMVAIGDSNSFSGGFAQMNFITKNKGRSFEYAHAGAEKTGHDFRLSYRSNSKTLYIANMHLYRKKGEKYFEILSSGLEADRRIKAFWVDRNNENEIWICKDDPTWGGPLEKKLWYTSDGGLTWIDRSASLPILKWRSITDIWKNDRGELAVSLEAFDKAGSEPEKVYISKDNGRTFHNVSKGLPNLPVNCISFAGSRWVCGTNNGVYYLDGKQWKILGNQFPASIVTELKYFSDEKLLIASTFGRGMWGISLK